MGCLFSKPPPQRYQLSSYDKLSILLSIDSLQKFWEIFNLNGIWNIWIYEYIQSDIVNGLRNMSNDQFIIEMLRDKNINQMFYNLPKNYLYKQFTPQILQQLFITPEELYKEDYSCFIQQDIQSEKQDDNQFSPHLSISSVKNDQKQNSLSMFQEEEQKLKQIGQRTNHLNVVQSLLTFYPNKPADGELREILQIFGIFTYIKQALYLDVWFGTIACDRFCWEFNSNSFTQRRVKVLDNKLIVFQDSQGQNVTNIIPILNSNILSLPQQNKKIGFKINYQQESHSIYFDSLEESELLKKFTIDHFKEKYQIKEFKHLSQCFNKELGIKLSLHIYESKDFKGILIMDSSQEFPGIQKLYSKFKDLNSNQYYVIQEYRSTTMEYIIEKKVQLQGIHIVINFNFIELYFRDFIKQLLTTILYLNCLGVRVNELRPSQIAIKYENGNLDSIQVMKLPFSDYSNDRNESQIVSYYLNNQTKSKELENFQKDVGKLNIEQLLNHSWFKEKLEVQRILIT
ncbi:hypothetical protein pb186bvf_010620 [Paramecium bursaria]